MFMKLEYKLSRHSFAHEFNHLIQFLSRLIIVEFCCFSSSEHNVALVKRSATQKSQSVDFIIAEGIMMLHESGRQKMVCLSQGQSYLRFFASSVVELCILKF